MSDRPSQSVCRTRACPPANEPAVKKAAASTPSRSIPAGR
jgi:hypothetical protein